MAGLVKQGNTIKKINTGDAYQPSTLDLGYKVGQVYGAQFPVITSDYYVKISDYVLLDSTGGSFTVYLPAQAFDGLTVILHDRGGALETNNVTVDGNGNTIMGDSTLILDISNSTTYLKFLNGDWRVV